MWVPLPSTNLQMNQGLFLHVFVWILARQTVRKTDRGCFLWLDSVTSDLLLGCEEREQEVTVPSCSVTTWKKPEKNKVQLQMSVAAQEINLDAAGAVGFLELSYIFAWLKKKQKKVLQNFPVLPDRLLARIQLVAKQFAIDAVCVQPQHGVSK